MKIDLTVPLGRVPEKKGQDTSVRKSQKCNTWGEAPAELIRIEICTVVVVSAIITCTKFRTEIFMGYGSTGGRILDFPNRIDSRMGLTTVQR